MHHAIPIARHLVLLGLALAALGSQPARAWDYEGHRVINQLALAALPTNVPAFAHSPGAQERIAFLSGEPDRWRNVPDLAVRHGNGPDHYLDLEELAGYGLKPADLTPFRYDFEAKLALVRAAVPEKFVAPDPARNEDHTRQLVGLLPWTLAEYYGKLKAAFAYLRALQENGGTPAEIQNAQENVLYLMGVMGHFAGDATQPLHLTLHHHGWVGANPKGYATNTSIHQWIDGGYFAKTGGLDAARLKGRIHPAHVRPDSGKGLEIFGWIVPFLVEQHKLVEPLYQLDKAGKLNVEPGAPEGRAFLETQLVAGGQLLGDLWLSAWQHAPEDKFLKSRLAERAAAPPAAGK